MLKAELPRSDKWRGLKSRWTILDYFIERLAAKGDEICNENEIRNEYYKKLQSLVCNGNTEVLETIELGPHYHFILISYYALFHKKDYDLAYKIFRKIYKIYEENKTLFNDDEERSLDYLRTIFERLTTIRNNCNMYKPGRGCLMIRVKEIADDLRQTKNTVKDAWSSLFKDLLTIHLNPDPVNEKEIRTKISHIKNTIETISDERSLLTEEIIDGYNIFSGGLSMTPYYFIYHMVQKTETALIKKLNEFKKYIRFYEFLKKLKTLLEKISGKFTSVNDIIAKDNIVRYIIFIILPIILPVLPINLLSWLNETLMLLSIILPSAWVVIMICNKLVINGIISYITRRINLSIEKDILNDIYFSICRTR
jgi:hypothetical protein